MRDGWLIVDVPPVARVCFVVGSGNVKHLTRSKNTAANSGNVKHPGEWNEHKKCGALSVYRFVFGGWGSPNADLYTECAPTALTCATGGLS